MDDKTTTNITPPQTDEVEGHASKRGAKPETNGPEAEGHAFKMRATGEPMSDDEPEVEGSWLKVGVRGVKPETDEPEVEGHVVPRRGRHISV